MATLEPKSVSQEIDELLNNREALAELLKDSRAELRERLLSAYPPDERDAIRKSLDLLERRPQKGLSPEDLARIFGA